MVNTTEKKKGPLQEESISPQLSEKAEMSEVARLGNSSISVLDNAQPSVNSGDISNRIIKASEVIRYDIRTTFGRVYCFGWEIKVLDYQTRK